MGKVDNKLPTRVRIRNRALLVQDEGNYRHNITGDVTRVTKLVASPDPYYTKFSHYNAFGQMVGWYADLYGYDGTGRRVKGDLHGHQCLDFL